MEAMGRWMATAYSIENVPLFHLENLMQHALAARMTANAIYPNPCYAMVE